jgi:hypothetical protein
VGRWVRWLRVDLSAVQDALGVLSDLAEYKEVFEKAWKVGARWNLQVDF